MVVFRDTRRFELTVEAHTGAWVATLRAFVPDRLFPTTYLLRNFTSREAAIAALLRKWRLLFPEDEPLIWRDPPTPSPRPIPPRRPAGRAV